MPMVIPVIVAFASGAVGAVIAGTATFAAYATVAGAVLSTVGALTGSKDLQKIGGIIGIVGGISGFASSAGSAASAAEAGSASAGDAVNGMDLASDQASAAAGNAAAETGAAATPAVDPGANPVVDPNQPASPVTGIDAPQQVQAAAAPTTTPMTAPDGSAVDTSGTNMFDRAAAAQGNPSGLASADATTSGLTPQQQTYTQLENSTPLGDAAKNTTASDLQSWFDRAMKAGKSVSQFAKDNPALLKIGGDMLTSMYGPQAEALDYQKSLMERARTNINAPVVLRYNGR